LNEYSFGHLSNEVAWSSYIAAESRETADTATTLALLAEVDERRLYLPAGYASMADYCVRKRGMTEEMAWLRIRVARTGRQFPAIFPALADGRLKLTSVLLLAPRLAPGNAEELLAAADGKSKDELKLLLAERFPRPDLPSSLEPVATTDETEGEPTTQLGLDPVGTLESSKSTVRMEPLSVRAKLEPRSAGRYTLQCTVDQETQELLRYVQSLLGHSVPSRDVGEILKRSLRVLATKLEQQKFGKCSRPGQRRGSKNPRYIPLEVKRAVWERDQGQCAFVGTGGKRCDARAPLEFDHVDPVARGGRATVASVRLLCRAHNQYTAERTYGADFMRGKREQAKQRAAEALAKREAKQAARAAADATAKNADEIIPWLRELGYNMQRARRGVELTAHIPDAPIEERMKVALRGLAPKCARILPHVATSSAT
jgi:5-methylcytosine-specific restriction endonuclease McrA